MAGEYQPRRSGVDSRGAREAHREDMTATPPFRAEHVGSLLRPAALRQAREKARAGAITTAQLHELEDACIREAVARQESVGLRVVTDGEYRRDFWHLDFLRRLDGIGLAPITGRKFAAEDVPPMPTVEGRVRCTAPRRATWSSSATTISRGALPTSRPFTRRAGGTSRTSATTAAARATR